jgi:hypothetical protein
VSLGDKSLNKKVADAIEEYVSRLGDILSQGVELGELRGGLDLRAASILLFGITQGLVNIWTLSNYGFDPLTMYERLWPVFREGVIKR